MAAPKRRLRDGRRQPEAQCPPRAAGLEPDLRTERQREIPASVADRHVDDQRYAEAAQPVHHDLFEQSRRLAPVMSPTSTPARWANQPARSSWVSIRSTR